MLSVLSWGVPLSSPLSVLVITSPDEFFIDLVSPLEQEVGQEVRRIIWYILAQVDKTFGQVRHNLVHQVLPDGLGSLVKQITLVLADRLKFGSIGFLSFLKVSFSVLFEELLLFSLLLGFLVLDLFAFNHDFDLINVTVRIFIFLLCFLDGEHLLLLILG